MKNKLLQKNLLLLIFTILHSIASAQIEQKAKFRIAHFSDTSFTAGSSIICEKIRFEPANVIVTKSSEKYLDSLIMILEKHHDLNAEISYYQKIWPNDMSTQLPAERAKEIKRYLENHGISEKRLRTTSTSSLVDINDERFKNQKGKKYFVEFRLLERKP